jgi:hypothetical protein
VSPECSINRYYDPTTDEFLSIDPDVAQTDQPYVFTNDDPLNAEDPLGLCWPSFACGVEHAVGSAGSWVAHHPLQVLAAVAVVAGIASGVGIFVAADAIVDVSAVEALEASEAAEAAVGTDGYGEALDNSIRAYTEAAKTTGEVWAHAAPMLLAIPVPLIGAGILLASAKTSSTKKPTVKVSTKK